VHNNVQDDAGEEPITIDSSDDEWLVIVCSVFFKFPMCNAWIKHVNQYRFLLSRAFNQNAYKKLVIIMWYKTPLSN
jgi:hypothetical protein